MSRTTVFRLGEEDPVWSSSPTKTHGISEENFQIPPDYATRRSKGIGALIPSASLASPDSGAWALEVGCGNNSLREETEKLQWKWVGCDFASAAADYFCDNHALPFADNAFSLVICKATLEHVRYPHVVIQELGRILRPSGILIGDVAFLQPYHRSYYHMTPAAVIDLLRFGNLEPTSCHNGQESVFSYLGHECALPKPADLALRALAQAPDLFYRAILNGKRLLLGRQYDPRIEFAVGVMFSATKRTAATRP
jgi:SAM-dependent methyltransferase